MFVLNFCLTIGIWSYFTSIFAGSLFSTGIIEGEVVEEGDNTSGVQNRAHLRRVFKVMLVLSTNKIALWVSRHELKIINLKPHLSDESSSNSEEEETKC